MLRLIWNTSTSIRTFMRVWMPTNILLDALRTRRGLRWGIPALLLSVGYFAIAYWCTTLIADGGPGCLHLSFLLGTFKPFNCFINAPTPAARPITARGRERKPTHPAGQPPTDPEGDKSRAAAVNAKTTRGPDSHLADL